MSIKKIKNRSISLIVIILYGFFIFGVHDAYSATFRIKTSNENLNVGDTITVSVAVNTEGLAINNAEATLRFPNDLLEVLSIDSQKSIFSSWIEQPRYSNDDGSITFNGGVPTPGFTGEFGEIFSIIFRAKNVGTAELFLTGSTIRANDGLGTDVFNGQNDLIVTVSTSASSGVGYLTAYFGPGTDTDDDGIPDQKEIQYYATDPNKSDTDTDGNPDGVEIYNGYSPRVKGQVVDATVAKKFSGRILLQVQERGEAWYVNPADNKRYFLGKEQDAFNIMKSLGLGVSNDDLAKIPISLDHRNEVDEDGDGLSNMIEDALKTDKYSVDTDGDGYDDLTEIKNNYSPVHKGKMLYDNKIINKYAGRILLQVQNNGEAWYVNPVDRKRYFLGRPEDAYELMKKRGVGILFNDLVKIKK